MFSYVPSKVRPQFIGISFILAGPRAVDCIPDVSLHSTQACTPSWQPSNWDSLTIPAWCIRLIPTPARDEPQSGNCENDESSLVYSDTAGLYSTITKTQKRLIIIVTALAAMLSRLSSFIYTLLLRLWLTAFMFRSSWSTWPWPHIRSSPVLQSLYLVIWLICWDVVRFI